MAATVAPGSGVQASVRRDGDALVFAGALDRAAVAALWRQLPPLRAGVRRIELAAVSHVDSAGLALLAELADGAAGGIAVTGTPPGLAELRAAYRLDEQLAYAR
ncbi:STAS domain-containing protein [Lysobacter koreensis]|uniref:STAS domain-containing protein n=1 Tax=Lysobacter koreensis TaxID=266122 RepID=A0ABW2YQC7_9GAMM